MDTQPSSQPKFTEKRATVIRSVVAVFLLGCLPWFLYSHTLPFEPVLDDAVYVLRNPLLQDAGNFLYPLDFTKMANSHKRWNMSFDLTLNFITRPVTYLTFFWNRAVNGTDTAGYRVINISIHMINGVLLYLLILALLGHHLKQSHFIALAFALCFSAHPMAVESVTYIAQRFESLSTLFCLGAVLSHVLKEKTVRHGVSITLSALSLAFTLMAMFSKETGFVVPLLLLLLEVAWLRKTTWQAVKAVRWHLALLPILPTLIVATQWTQDGKLALTSVMHITNNSATPYDIPHYLMTQVCAWISYLALLLMPIGQSFDHSYPLVTSASSPQFLVSLTVVMLILAGSWHFMRRSGSSSRAIPFVGAFWFFATLAPSSSIVPLPDLFSEHRSYLPSVGLFIAMAAWVQVWMKKMSPGRARITLGVGVTLCVLLLSVATLLRNEVMRSRESIWQDALAKGSESSRVMKGLGIVASNAGRHEDAFRYFERGAKVNPRDLETWMNLATLNLMLGRHQSALDVTNQALKFHQNKVPLMNLHAMAMANVGRWKEGMKIWEAILVEYPDYRESHVSLAEIHYQTGNPQKALQHLLAAEKTGPLSPSQANMKHQLKSQLVSLQ